MNRPSVYFHPDYAPDDQPHYARLAHVACRLRELGVREFAEATPLEPDLLLGLHAPDYVEAVMRGIEPLASSSHLRWTPSLRDSCLRMLGGQIEAAKSARAHGVSFNLACGFHHALPARGGGFCIFNGLALLADVFPDWQIGVLDCDEHGADGTEVFCRRLSNLRQVSIFGTRFGIRGGLRSLALAVPKDDELDREVTYLEVLDQGLDWLVHSGIDLLIYQAGMDCHESDPKSTLKLSTATIEARDFRVLSLATAARIPVLVVLGGAYQNVDRIADLYSSTWLAAVSGMARNSEYSGTVD